MKQDHPPLIAVAIILLALCGVAVFNGGNLSPGVGEDRANRWVIVALRADRAARCVSAGVDGPEGVLDSPFAGLVSFSSLPAMRWIWPVFVLCRRFSGLVAKQAGHDWSLWYPPPSELSGSARQLSGLGARLSFGVGVLLTGLLMPSLLARIHAEERLLRSHFGDEYDVYRRRGSRLVPGVYEARAAAKHPAGNQPNTAPGRHRNDAWPSVRLSHEQREFSGILHRYITMDDSTKVALRGR